MHRPTQIALRLLSYLGSKSVVHFGTHAPRVVYEKNSPSGVPCCYGKATNSGLRNVINLPIPYILHTFSPRLLPPLRVSCSVTTWKSLTLREAAVASMMRLTAAHPVQHQMHP